MKDTNEYYLDLIFSWLKQSIIWTKITRS